MTAVFKARTPEKQVPRGRVRIDWTHPLARGLKFAFLPGMSGGIDLTGNNYTLDPASAVSQAVSPDGPGCNHTVANSGYNGPTRSDLYGWNEFTLYARAYQIGSGSGNAAYLGIAENNADTFPWVVAELSSTGSGPTSALAVKWQTGGSPSSVTISAASAGSIVGFGGTFKVGGNATAYKNGVNAGSATFGASVPTSQTNGRLYVGQYMGVPTRFTNSIITCGYGWGRELSAAEMALLDADPYGFFISDEDEWPAIAVTSADPTGTLDATETPDTAAFTGSVVVSGTLAVTEETDTAAFVGTVGNVTSGTLAVTETPDTAAFTGSVVVSGTVAVTESPDTAAFAGGVLVSGTLAVTEGQDTAAFVGVVASAITGTLAVTEAQDTALFVELAIGGTQLKGQLFKPKVSQTYSKHYPASVQQKIKLSAQVLSTAGGHARAASLTAKQRSNIATHAANTRWK